MITDTYDCSTCIDCGEHIFDIPNIYTSEITPLLPLIILYYNNHTDVYHEQCFKNKFIANLIIDFDNVIGIHILMYAVKIYNQKISSLDCMNYKIITITHTNNLLKFKQKFICDECNTQIYPNDHYYVGKKDNDKIFCHEQCNCNNFCAKISGLIFVNRLRDIDKIQFNNDSIKHLTEYKRDNICHCCLKKFSYEYGKSDGILHFQKKENNIELSCHIQCADNLAYKDMYDTILYSGGIDYYKHEIDKTLYINKTKCIKCKSNIFINSEHTIFFIKSDNSYDLCHYNCFYNVNFKKKIINNTQYIGMTSSLCEDVPDIIHDLRLYKATLKIMKAICPLCNKHLSDRNVKVICYISNFCDISLEDVNMLGEIYYDICHKSCMNNKNNFDNYKGFIKYNANDNIKSWNELTDKEKKSAIKNIEKIN